MTNWATKTKRARHEQRQHARLSDPEYAPTLNDRITAIVHNPDLFTIAQAFPAPNQDGAGAPCGYPNWVWVLMNALAGAFGSQRKVIAYLHSPDVWNTITTDIASIHGVEHVQGLAPTPPSRTTWRHHNKRVERCVGHIQTVTEQCALYQAQEQDCLTNTARSSVDVTARSHVVCGDGTVIKAAVNKKTAEKNPEKYAGAFGTYIEGGEERGHRVYGNKYIDLSCRPNNDPHGRIILAFRRQDAARSGREAEQAVEMIRDLQQRSGDVIHAVTWDGALRGKHRRALLDAGILPITPHHKGTKARRYPEPQAGMDLWTHEGALCDRKITLDGRTHYVPLTLTKSLRRPNKNGGCRWYGQYAHPETGEIFTARWHGDVSDDASKYNRAEHLQPYPPGSPQYDAIYGYRADTESLHSELDNRLFRGRMTAYTPTRQDLVVLWFMFAQNSLSRYVHAQRRAAETLAAA